MQHPDEGTIHAWLDGALSAEEAQRLEAHVAGCASCAEAVAEARGLVAASSRILGALDTVPGQVVPAAGTSVAAARVRSRRRWWSSPAVRAAAAVLLVTGVGYGVFRGVVPDPGADRSSTALSDDSQRTTEPLTEQQSATVTSVQAESAETDASARFEASSGSRPAAAQDQPAPALSPPAAEVAERSAAVVPSPPAPGGVGRAASAQGAGAAADAGQPPAEVAARERRAESGAVAGDLPRLPLVPDTMRREILNHVVPYEVGKVSEEAAAPAAPVARGAQPAARGAVAAGRAGPSPAVRAAPSPRAPGEVLAVTEADTVLVLEVVSERADTNVLGVLRTVVYRVRPGITVTHQSFMRRFPRIGVERERRDSDGAEDAAGERTHLRLDMDRVQAIHWTDEAEVYHSLSGPVEQEELLRIRAALRARGALDWR